jgi:hypothetical protein
LREVAKLERLSAVCASQRKFAAPDSHVSEQPRYSPCNIE